MGDPFHVVNGLTIWLGESLHEVKWHTRLAG